MNPSIAHGVLVLALAAAAEIFLGGIVIKQSWYDV
jgi:hypothetical protein